MRMRGSEPKRVRGWTWRGRQKGSPDKPRAFRSSATWHLRDRRPATRPCPCQLPRRIPIDRCASPQMRIVGSPCGGGVESLLGPSGLYVHSIQRRGRCQAVPLADSLRHWSGVRYPDVSCLSSADGIRARPCRPSNASSASGSASSSAPGNAPIHGERHSTLTER